MQRFFGDIIGFRENDKIGIDPYPNINKKLYRRLENFYRDMEIEYRGVKILSFNLNISNNYVFIYHLALRRSRQYFR